MSVFRLVLMFAMPALFCGKAIGAGEEQPQTAEQETVAVVIGSAKYDVPKSWKRQQTGRRFRVAAFALPLAEGDKDAAEVIVFHFGKGQGGSVEANLDRWKKQFRERENEDKVETIKAGGMEMTVLDMTGTYLYRPAPFVQEVTPRNGYRMVNAIVPLPKDGPYFIRMVGPKNSVAAQVEGLHKMLTTIQPQ